LGRTILIKKIKKKIKVKGKKEARKWFFSPQRKYKQKKVGLLHG
jgi:hypothetical protein